ncbi:hypothetical protein [Caballeronia sp. GaOx3]|nr:hypothetical protein [Caballeronia sp. GaOx3]
MSVKRESHARIASRSLFAAICARPNAYETFSHAADTHALKVIIEASG